MKEEKDSIFQKYKEQFQDALNDLKTKGRRYRQIPNILTVSRITAPFFIIPAAFSGNLPLVVGLTAAFGLTDLVDGFIARHWNLTSELGKNLDAVCDKVFAGTLLISASLTNPILLCNLALEGLIAGINIVKTMKGENVNSTFAGKVKTWALFSLAGLGLIAPLLNINGPLNTLVGLTAAMQGLTILSYLHKDDNNRPRDKNDKNEIKNTTSNDDQLENEIQQEKLKVIEIETKTSKDDKIIDIQDLISMKEYLLSQKQPPIEPENIKVFKKTLDQKKVVGGIK